MLRELLPPDDATYLGFLGRVLAEHSRHPDVRDALRRTVLRRRRDAALRVVERSQRRGHTGTDLDAATIVEMLGGRSSSGGSRSSTPASNGGSKGSAPGGM